MATDNLILLPAFDAVARTAVEFLTQGKNVALVAPPGTGTSSLASAIQSGLSTARVPFKAFNCKGKGELADRLAAFKPPKPKKGKPRVIIIDHAALLPIAQLQTVLDRIGQLQAAAPTTPLWLGPLDTRTLKATAKLRLHSDARTHLCLPELGRDDLLSIYRAIAMHNGRLWGEAMLYFALDWCGTDLALAEQLVAHFYGNWTEHIYDEAVAECLRNWLTESDAVRGYRERFAALPDACKEQLRLLCGGGKLVSHRPEVHLETCEKIRRLFLDGFLCANLLPGYCQLRNLVARFVVEEHMGLQNDPIDLLRRAANARVNLLLQDVEFSLRGMLKTVFRQMPADDLKKLLKNIKSQQPLVHEDFHPKLMDWASQQTPPGQPDLRASLGQFLAQESAKFRATNNLWSEVCKVFRESHGLDNINSEPTPEQAVVCLTFNQLKDLVQTLSDKLFLDEPRTKRFGEPPSKRWPIYLTRVRRLRNDVAHLRNTSFQDIEDLLKDLNELRQDQLAFGIIP
jgi:hypothetical protein